MSEPTRVKPFPRQHVDRAIAALVGCLDGPGFARLEYPTEPTTRYTLDELKAMMGASRAERQLDPEARRAVRSFSDWRQDVTSRRSQNEARLTTLLWTLDKTEAAGDTFAAGAVAAFLREEWRVFDAPEPHEREAFARNVCRVECRRGVLSL